MNAQVRQAFLLVRDGYSPDRVVTDPDLNQRFLAACRERGLTESAFHLNTCLLNMRKAGGLTGLPRSRRTSFADQDEYAFASEMAVRFLERRDAATLDRIICDPALAAEFDRIAGRIAPGYTPLQYRWAALSLRKARNLRPEPLGQAIPPEAVESGRVAQLDPTTLPTAQGLYLFFDASTPLYAGETKNLRKRIQKHLEHSDNRGLAHWLWQHGSAQLHVEYHVLPAATATRIRKSMETELIRSRRPVFNMSGRMRREDDDFLA